MKANLWFDGSSSPRLQRPASWGFTLETEGREVLEIQGMVEEELPQTNNSAEYSALLNGLLRAIQEGVTDIIIFGDSQLVIYQVTGKYKVNRSKHPHLDYLHGKVLDNLKLFNSFTLTWQPQEKNKADGISRVNSQAGNLQRSTKSPTGKITLH